jgi:hypothetical protein
MILVDEDPDTDVEFAVIQKERSLYVLLDYECVVLYLVAGISPLLL